MPQKAKKRLIRTIIAAIILILGIAVQITNPIKTLPIHIFIYIIAYFVAGVDVIIKAALNIKQGMLLDENFLMGIATIGALYIGEYLEAVAVMVFYQIGELFSDIAVYRARKSLKSLMDLHPDYANLVRGDEVVEVEPEQVEIGDIILVRPGEKIALDGVVIEGGSALDVSAVLGETYPKEVGVGDSVPSGCILKDGTLKIRVSAKYADSTVAKIIALGEMASMQKSRQESFVTRFARVYTPIVVALAAALTVIPPFLGGDFSVWFHRALMFLVVSCPCALVVSVPLSFFCGMGAASKKGILAKGGSALEALSKVNIVCFDKTGTLTDGKFRVDRVESYEMDNLEFLNLAAAIEKNSTHPIALSIVAAGNSEGRRVENHKNYAGKGVSTEVDGVTYFAGTAKFMRELGIDVKDTSEGIVHFATKEKAIGYIKIADNLKANTVDTVKELQRLGIKKTVLLTGASQTEANETAAALSIDEAHGGLLPEDKLNKVTRLKEGGKLCYVGDGINDVPVLAVADVGVSMGVAGSDAAIDVSDAVIMDDSVAKLTTAIKLGKRTTANARTNIIISLTVKAAVLLLSALGLTNMWVAVFADVGVCVLAVLNATRLLRCK